MVSVIMMIMVSGDGSSWKESEGIQSTRKIYLVSTSEKRADKKQFDHEDNLFANNQCPLCHTFIHLLFLSLQEKWRRPVYGFLNPLSYFSVITKPFCFFVVISKFLRRDICGTFPGDRKIFAQSFSWKWLKYLWKSDPWFDIMEVSSPDSTSEKAKTNLQIRSMGRYDITVGFKRVWIGWGEKVEEALVIYEIERCS